MDKITFKATEIIRPQLKGMRFAELRMIILPIRLNTLESYRGIISNYDNIKGQYSSHIINDNLYAFRRFEDASHKIANLYVTADTVTLDAMNIRTGNTYRKTVPRSSFKQKITGRPSPKLREIIGM